MSEATDRTKTEVSAEAAQQTGEQKTRAPGPGKVARTYFDAVAARDIDAMAACWKAGGIENIAPLGRPLSVPGEMRAFFEETFAAMPDMRFEVLDVVAARNQAAVRWHATGTFCGGPFQGIEPTGARVELEGIDLLTVEDGQIVRNDAYYDSGAFARAVGLLPPQQSTTERRMAAAFNTRTRLLRPFVQPAVSQVAEDVWLVRGGFPQKVMNVYLIEDDGQVTVFDAGIRSMVRGIGSVAAGLGGIKRIVLGHGHPDHRGAAPGLGAPVYCHPDNRADTEGDGGEHYFRISELDWYARPVFPRMLGIWDGGPVKVEGTVSEGDDIAGFKVIDLPGHAPGQIGLWREDDRLALTSDCFYTLNPQTGQKGAARIPHPAFNWDTDKARASIRKLAELEPAAAWPGHADPLKGDVRGQLEQALAG
ncbi:MAG TPA: nuclear transport factor 2 family protein [Solirubrobacterales bacterium]|nr:nuclear transport factor 2 family protein [Solirubrobacterales bacterium]